MRTAENQSRMADMLALGKPGITVWCALVTLGSMLMAGAGGELSAVPVILTVLGTALAVMAANGFNMVMEREPDRRMERTRDRPVASGRMKPSTACLIAAAEATVGVVVLWIWAGPLSALTAAAAVAWYLFIYTPLKYRTRFAFLLGTVPGAAPALVGWTAAAGTIDPAAVGVFLILVAWQVPHTLAIAIRYREDYERAGVISVPAAKGEASARVRVFLWTSLLFSLSLILVVVGAAGYFYFLAATAVGGYLVVLGVRGLEPAVGKVWARTFFRASIVYLPVLTAGLLLDRLLL
jgi:protoheme IX farnesyltransferase